MEVHQFVQVLLIILITARVFAELATRLKAPSVIGELVAGVVLGPSLMGWIEPYEAIKLLAEIGIILLLFEVGLDTDLKQLAESGWQSVLVAVGGFSSSPSFSVLPSATSCSACRCSSHCSSAAR